MKILISAYACETGRGSEGEICWRLVLRLAEKHDVWVITRANLKLIHELAFQHTPKPHRLNFVYFDLPWIFRFYKKGARFFLIYYYLWQIGVGLKALMLNKKHKFDILHHLIGGMDWMPSGLAMVPGKFVWGPVGSENTHPYIRKYLSKSSKIKDIFRSAVRWWMRNLDPFVRLTGERASVVLSHTPETMPKRYLHKMHAFTQTGIENSPLLAKCKQNYDRAASLRLIFVGELKDWKGARLALDSALRFFEFDSKATLRIVGDGPLRYEMEAVAKSHPQGSRVTFLGRLTMDGLVQELHDSDVFVYPSFHHGLATVVLQAMLTGLPVVCIEGDATGRVVGARAGVTVPLFDGSDPGNGIAQALLMLAQNEPERQRLARAAREIAINEYNYDSLAQNLGDILTLAAITTRTQF